MRGEHTVVPPLIAADPAQPCPLAQVGGRTPGFIMGGAPAAQCCLGCALGVSRARWLGGAPTCCLVRCLNCHPAALAPLLCVAGPAAAAFGAQPPRPAVAGGRRRQLPQPSGAHSGCGARAQAVAVPTPGGPEIQAVGGLCLQVHSLSGRWMDGMGSFVFTPSRALMIAQCLESSLRTSPLHLLLQPCPAAHRRHVDARARGRRLGPSSAAGGQRGIAPSLRSSHLLLGAGRGQCSISLWPAGGPGPASLAGHSQRRSAHRGTEGAAQHAGWAVCG